MEPTTTITYGLSDETIVQDSCPPADWVDLCIRLVPPDGPYPVTFRAETFVGLDYHDRWLWNGHKWHVRKVEPHPEAKELVLVYVDDGAPFTVDRAEGP